MVYIIEQFNFRTQSNISAFVHPITGKVILENNDFDIRKSICDKAYEIYKNDDYKFKNQSITQLSMNLFKNMVGKLEKSTYNSLVNNILNEYAPKPFTEGYASEYSSFSRAFDNYKSYSTVLYNNKCNIPIYNIFCDFKDYDNREIECGEYFIDNVITKYEGDKPFIIPAGVYSWNLIKYLLDNKLIKKKQIKKMLLPCGELPFEIFSNFVKEIYTKFNEIEAKKIINMFIGNMGTKYNKTINGAIVDNEAEARALHALHDNVEIYPFNNLYLVKQCVKNRLDKDNTSIHRFVISGGIINILETLKIKYNPQASKLISIRTDCVYIDKPFLNKINEYNENNKPIDNFGKIKTSHDIHKVNIKIDEYRGRI